MKARTERNSWDSETIQLVQKSLEMPLSLSEDSRRGNSYNNHQLPFYYFFFTYHTNSGGGKKKKNSNMYVLALCAESVPDCYV